MPGPGGGGRGPGGPGGGPGGPGGFHGGMGGMGGFRGGMGGWGHRPPPRRRGCCGCMMPVIGIVAVAVAGILMLLL